MLSYFIQYPLLSYKYFNIPVHIELLHLSYNRSTRSAEGLDALIKNKQNLIHYSTSEHWEHLNKNFPFPA
jgi:hypothetical protein